MSQSTTTIRKSGQSAVTSVFGTVTTTFSTINSVARVGHLKARAWEIETHLTSAKAIAATLKEVDAEKDPHFQAAYELLK